MNATAHRRAISNGTVEMSPKNRSGDTSNASYWGYVWVRYADGSNRIRLSFEPGKVALLEQYLGAYTTLDQDTSFTTTQDTWYNYRIVADGAHIEVWRNEDGQMPVKVLETNSSQVTTTASIGFATTANSTSDFDDIRILSDSLATTTTMTYTNANEISTLTDPNGTQTFGFDDWGRMTSKSRGSFSATYGYAYGDKLIDVTSNFPGEGGVSYDYGADQKRRLRDDGSITRYRWDAEWNLVSEENDANVLSSTFVYSYSNDASTTIAESTGSNPAFGTWKYFISDAGHSTRGILDSSKLLVAKFEYGPFGDDLLSSGIGVSNLYTGHAWDSKANLYFAPYRFYAPDTTRWLTQDPMGTADGPNLYS